MKKETVMTPCVFCGENATKTNRRGQPVCKKHREEDPREVACPECGMPMKLKEGRYGYFWGCEGYPQCEKTYQIKALVEEEDSE